MLLALISFQITRSKFNGDSEQSTSDLFCCCPALKNWHFYCDFMFFVSSS